MSIREVARELYRLNKEMERIKGMLQAASSEQKGELEIELKRIAYERDRIKAILEGMKQYPDIRRPR